MTSVARILAQVLCIAVTFASAAASDIGSGQLCWAIGKLDNTVYFAAIEGREDRSASFASLIEISGIEPLSVTCSIQGASELRSLRARLINQWKDQELEVVDTNFLSDLDY